MSDDPRLAEAMERAEGCFEDSLAALCLPEETQSLREIAETACRDRQVLVAHVRNLQAEAKRLKRDSWEARNA